jgi:hypothetical protein
VFFFVVVKVKGDGERGKETREGEKRLKGI